MFYVYTYYDLEHQWSLASPWPDGSRKGLGQLRYFKRKLVSTDQTSFIQLSYIMLSIIYIDLYCAFDFLDAHPSKFSFIPSFTKHVVLLIFFFQVESCPLIHGVVICPTSCLLGSSLCSIVSTGLRLLKCYTFF